MAGSEKFKLSNRLRDALVADLVVDDDSGDGDDWLTAPLREPLEWTRHLGRQLHMNHAYDESIHLTLLVVVRELDPLVKNWPPNHEGSACQDLAHLATKDLDPLEIVEMLWAGPRTWRDQRVDLGCKVEKVPDHLQTLLERSFAAELRRMLVDWDNWDVPRLADRRRRERAEREAAEARARADGAKRIVVAPIGPDGKPIPPPPTARVGLRERRESFYRPPGKA